MFNRFTISALMMVVLLCWPCAEAAIIDINDGGFHEIDWSKPVGYEDSVRVDWGRPGVGTSVKVVSGARIGSIDGLEDSSVTIEGGEIIFPSGFDNRSTGTIVGGVMGGIMGLGDSRITFKGGQINGSLMSSGNCEVIVEGGTVGELTSNGESRVNVYGGQISWQIHATQNSSMFIYGTDFTIDGLSVGYGPISAMSGTLSGILYSGEALNVSFDIIENASIMLIPEPATVLLLGIGAVLLRGIRRHR